MSPIDGGGDFPLKNQGEDVTMLVQSGEKKETEHRVSTRSSFYC